ncbi:MAG TPA: DUF4157 domain-containing protein [Bacteroidia bacterium]|nr:DUF4157 domain-containing protein [Bacteroidia bacterium]
MKTHADKTQGNKNNAPASFFSNRQKSNTPFFQSKDNRQPEAIAQRETEEMAGEDAGEEELKDSADAAQLQTAAGNNSAPALQQPKAETGNNTGLPDQIKTGVEDLSGYSMDDVKVHYNSAEPAQLNALAYARSSDIHLAPGQEKHLPHEAWHVVQQKQGRVQPTMQMKHNVQVNDDPVLEREADVKGNEAASLGKKGIAQAKKSVPYVPRQFANGTAGCQTLQMVPFLGPALGVAGNDNTAYPGHAFNPGGMRANTNCGIQNSITTAGELLAPGTASKPGNPKKMNSYRGGFSRPGGLVKDKNVNQASTKMHLINHRLENSGNTQNTPRNIFLGTQMSNNPTHLNQVETPVINAVTNHGTQENAGYENAMANAAQVQDVAGNNVLYWPNGVAGGMPDPNALPHLTDVYFNGGIVDTAPPPLAPLPGGQPPAKKKKPNYDGEALAYNIGLPAYANAAGTLRHLWLTYTVTANYGGIPPHVRPGAGSNEAVETAFANTKKGKQKANLLKKINDFQLDFAPNAFPSTFTNDVDYYYASYDPGNIYVKENENHQINADL